MIDLLWNLWMTINADVQKILIAVLIGGLLGIERELGNKAAGLRTMILICVGSTLFTILSRHIELDNGGRIVANIITGIGFIGAGAIFRDNARVSGLTTASLIWISAALGIGVGSGEFALTTASASIIIGLLIIFSRIESFAERIYEIRTYSISTSLTCDTQVLGADIFSSSGLKYKLVRRGKDGDIALTVWKVRGGSQRHAIVTEKLMANPEVKSFQT